MTSLHQAVLKTLAYADIFDYPLTRSELQTWLISSKPISLSAIPPHPQILTTNNYYHLKNRQAIVKLRRQRARFSSRKLKLAQAVSLWLRLIPSIKFIAVTGALAMNNSTQDDDIDLLIITKPNRLWSTRLLTILLLELLGRRRRPQTQALKDKLCLNLFLDEFSLQLPPSRRNLYTAHELTQLKPLFDRGDTYQTLLSQNLWLKKFLSNFPQLKDLQPTSSPPQTPLPFIESLLFKLQHAYMKSKITHEKITPHSAFFHPRPTSQIILKAYQQKLKTLGIK